MNLISESFSDRNIDDNVRQLVRESGIPLGVLAEAVGWKNYQILEWWACRGPTLDFNNLRSLAQFLGISMDALFQGNYDIGLIRMRIFKGPNTLPENYSEHASSYVRTLAHIIEYLAMLYGRHFTDNLLRNLNIHPLFFDKLDNKINLTFYMDIFNKLSEMGLSDREISSLACYIFLSLRDTEIGLKFKTAKNHQESYAILAENATQFETNFDYDFQIDSDRIRIIAKPTEAALFLSRKSPEEYKRLFMYRKNVFSWFPTLSNLSPLHMTTTKCILRGDPLTIYEADTPNQASHLKILRSL